MHDILVSDSKFFLFIFLLILKDEVVKEDFIKSIDVFLDQELDSFNGGLLVLAETDLISI